MPTEPIQLDPRALATAAMSMLGTAAVKGDEASLQIAFNVHVMLKAIATGQLLVVPPPPAPTKPVIDAAVAAAVVDATSKLEI
jgi:hypothetical protein